MRPWYLLAATIFTGVSCAPISTDAVLASEAEVTSAKVAAANSGATKSGPTADVTDPEGLGRLAHQGVIVIGEVHGSKEVPGAFLQLVESILSRSASVIVALEMPPEAIAAGCETGNSEGVDQFWTRKVQDGRSSMAMRELVCDLKERASQKKVRLVFFGSSARNPSGVARRMNAELNTADAPMAILVGNFHARNAPNSLVGMLRAGGLEVTSLTTSSPDATTWNCGPDGCSARRIIMNFCPTNTASPYRLTTAIRDNRWDGCMVLPRLTASPPSEVTPARS